MYFLIFVLLKIVFGSALCPSGSIQGLDGSGNCYKLYLTPKAYADAQSLCFKNGGQLASIKDAFTNTFISTLLNETLSDNKIPIWLGGNSVDSPWHWVDGTPFSYTNWAKGQPNSNAACLSIQSSDGKWYSNNCSNNQGYICEFPQIPETTKVTPTCPTCPSCNSCCQSCTTPCSGSCPSGWTYNMYNNKCYQWQGSAVPFNSAENLCQSLGGHLPSIHNFIENSFLVMLLFSQYDYPGDPKAIFWIGYNNLSGQVWTDGSEIDYTNWMDGNPDFKGNVQCTVIAVGDGWGVQLGQWFSIDCDNHPVDSFCEKPAN